MNEAPDRPLRVTFLIGSLDVGGAEQQMVRLINNLDRTRFQPSVLCLYRGGPLEARLDPSVPVAGVQLDRVRHRGVRSKALLAVRILWTITRGLRRQRPDVLHAFMPTAYVLGAVAARVLRVRVVIASRRALVSFHIYPYARWRMLARLANRLIDLHLCNSEAVRRYAIEREGLDPARTAVVYNGLDLGPLDRTVSLPEGWTRPGAVMVACVANLIDYKNHRMLLAAFATAAGREPRLRLVLLGDGPERARLEAQARDLGIDDRVVFAGLVADAARYLPGFDLAVLSSDEEGFPNAVMEALAGEVPVVATSVGGVVELIDDGVEGILVPKGDAPAMAAGIVRLAADPDLRRRMGAAGRARIGRQFAVSAMVESTQRTYQRLARRRVPMAAVSA